ncbi:MAG: universal stress protein [Solitalea-like symbiont of Tyrophagus putrescentiae]
MKKIVVPVDFSEDSIKAVNVAINIAKQNKEIEVKLVHINTFLAEPGLNVDTAMKILNEHKNEMLSSIRKVKNMFKGTNVKVHSQIEVDAFVSQGVVNIAKDYEADLIIMGTLGSNTLIKKIIGSNTLSVIDQTEIPVLVVRTDLLDYNIKDILFVSEENQGINVSYLDKAKKFASDINASIKILVVKNITTNIQEEVNSINHIGDISIEYINSSETLVNVLNDYIERKAPYGLIAMPTLKYGFFEKLWNTEDINALVNKAHFPLLLYPYNK